MTKIRKVDVFNFANRELPPGPSNFCSLAGGSSRSFSVIAYCIWNGYIETNALSRFSGRAGLTHDPFEISFGRCSLSIRLKCDDDDVEINFLGCQVDILRTNCDQCVCMVQCCFTSTETIRLIRTESPGRPPRLSHSS